MLQIEDETETLQNSFVVICGPSAKGLQPSIRIQDWVLGPRELACHWVNIALPEVLHMGH
jgi:hypothetical protein